MHLLTQYILYVYYMYFNKLILQFKRLKRSISSRAYYIFRDYKNSFVFPILSLSIMIIILNFILCYDKNNIRYIVLKTNMSLIM